MNESDKVDKTVNSCLIKYNNKFTKDRHKIEGLVYRSKSSGSLHTRHFEVKKGIFTDRLTIR